MATGWTVSVDGQDLRGTAQIQWTDPQDPSRVFRFSRSGHFSPESLAAMLPIAIAERNAWLVSEAAKVDVAAQIAAALNAADTREGA